jgi:hypothetical protein
MAEKLDSQSYFILCKNQIGIFSVNEVPSTPVCAQSTWQ